METAPAPAPETVSLEAKSPFEMRVHLGEGVPETDVRSALKTGDMGFLHSFTTGSAVDGPGIRLVAWTTACMFRCRYCHNPDTWTLANGIPVTLEKAIDEVRKYANGLRAMHGGFTLSGGEPLMQDRFAARLFEAVHGMGVHTAIETNGWKFFTASVERAIASHQAEVAEVVPFVRGQGPPSITDRMSDEQRRARALAFAELDRRNGRTN